MYILKELSNSQPYKPKKETPKHSDKKIRSFIALVEKEKRIRLDFQSQIKHLCSEQQQAKALAQLMIDQERSLKQEIARLQTRVGVQKSRLSNPCKQQVLKALSCYFRGFNQCQLYSGIIKHISFRVYNTLSNCMARKKFLPKIRIQLSNIVKRAKFRFQRREMLVTVKDLPGQQMQLQVTQYSNTTNTSKTFVGKRVISKSNYRRYSNIENYLWLDLKSNQIYTIDEYIMQKAEIRLTMIVLKVKILSQLKNYRFKSKFKLDYFYQNHILQNPEQKQIIFFAKMTVTQGTLWLDVESVSEKLVKIVLPLPLVSIDSNTDYKAIFDNFMLAHHISLRQNKFYTKIAYFDNQPIIFKFQALFRGYKQHQLYHKYRAENNRKCLIKGDTCVMRFISYIQKELFIVVSFVSSLREKPYAFRFNLRYGKIIQQQFHRVVRVEDRDTFMTFIKSVNQKIEQLETQNQHNFKVQLKHFGEIFKRFLLRYRLKKAAKTNYLQIKFIQMGHNKKMLMIARNAWKILGSIEVYVYSLHQKKTHYKFLLGKQPHVIRLIQSQKLEKLLYITEKCCILRSHTQPQFRIVTQLTELTVQQKTYLYEIYSEGKTGFYMDVMIMNGRNSCKPVGKREIPKKQLVEMTEESIESKVRDIIGSSIHY